MLNAHETAKELREPARKLRDEIPDVLAGYAEMQRAAMVEGALQMTGKVGADVGVAERSERLLVALVAAGLTGLGVPFVLAIGLWAVALGSTVTCGQRVWVVRKAVGPGVKTGTGGEEQR